MVTYCVRNGANRDFPKQLVYSYYNMHSSCRDKQAERQGNLISGEVRCQADPKLANGSSRFIYQSIVSEDTVRAKVRLDLDVDPNQNIRDGQQAVDLKAARIGLRAMRFIIEAKRVGECR